MLKEGSRRWFHGSREPYALSLAGETLYIITDPEDITAVHNSKVMVFDGYIRHLMAVMQVQRATVDKLYHLVSEHEMSPTELKLNPRAKHFTNFTQIGT